MNTAFAQTKIPEWLWIENLLDEGSKRALYPYPLLNNILRRDDCREAVLDETGALEHEFGREQIRVLVDQEVRHCSSSTRLRRSEALSRLAGISSFAANLSRLKAP